MHGMQSWVVAGLLAVAAGACGPDEHDSYEMREEAAAQKRAAKRAPVPRPAAAPVDSAREAARLAARQDSVNAAFLQVRRLKWGEVFGLRRDKNAEQIAVARSLGVRASGEAEIERLVRQGKLVALGDSTPYWVLRKMDHSVPYVTPDTRAMLLELGKQFHARLDSVGLPRYRMKITSALRTDDTQAELRKINPNASQTVSAHEFGTTVDISHERFAVPAGLPPVDTAASAVPTAEQMEAEMLEEVAKANAKALQAELGRTLTAMREAGALKVMMEDAQPVYHMTVARRFAAGR